jgi:hypothetical protein
MNRGERCNKEGVDEKETRKNESGEEETEKDEESAGEGEEEVESQVREEEKDGPKEERKMDMDLEAIREGDDNKEEIGKAVGEVMLEVRSADERSGSKLKKNREERRKEEKEWVD